MHSAKYDELYFAMQYVAGLRDDIKAIVEPQVPLTVDRAALIAKIQQKVLDRSKQKFQRQIQANKPQQQRQEGKQTTPMGLYGGIDNSEIIGKQTTCASTMETSLNPGTSRFAPRKTNHSSMH